MGSAKGEVGHGEATFFGAPPTRRERRSPSLHERGGDVSSKVASQVKQRLLLFSRNPSRTRTRDPVGGLRVVYGLFLV